MLNFIVSGQIPGTPIVITFQWVMAVVSLCIGMSLARQIVKPYRQAEASKLEDTTL